MDTDSTIAEFKNHLKIRGYASTTIGCYNYFLKLFLDYLQKQGMTDLKQVSHQTLREYQLLGMDKYMTGETRALRIRPVKRLFEYLVESNRLLLNPTEGIIETNRKNRPMAPVLTEEEMTRLFEQPNLSLRMHIRDRAIMEVLYTSGIRANELVNLEIYHVDLREKVLFVKKGKGKRQRVVPMGKSAVKYLREYLEKIRPRYARKNPKERRLFLTNRGDPVTANTIRAFLRIYRLSAGIEKPVSPHGFRRACATHLLKNGADIRYVQKLLGHKRLRTTQYYTKVMPIDIKKIHEQYHPGVSNEDT